MSSEPSLAKRYERAQHYLPHMHDVHVINAEVKPHWIGHGDRFWFSRVIAEGAREFVILDAATGDIAPAFDHQKVALGLSVFTKREVNPAQLPFEEFEFKAEESKIEFVLEDQVIFCDLESGICHAVTKNVSSEEVVSPDGKWAAFIRDHNLWLRPVTGAGAVPLTTDGVEHFAYGVAAGHCLHTVSDQREGVKAKPILMWSPDSRYILTHQLDERDVAFSHLLQYAPEDGSLRPKLWSFKYAMPNDEHQALETLLIINIQTKAVTPVDIPPIINDGDTTIDFQLVWWSSKSDCAYLITREPYYKTIYLNCVDVTTGKVTKVLSESSETYVQTHDLGSWPNVHVLENGDIIWASEDDGYRHLYLYDKTGQLKHRLTSGVWMVRSLVRVSEAQKRVYFMASGREAQRDPYFQHLYSVRLDGSDLKLLTPENAEHQEHVSYPSAKVVAQAQGLNPFTSTSSMSASARYFVDTFSTPTQAPISVLRNTDGELIAELQRADTSSLNELELTLPEPFEVLSADGVTPLYGTMFKPSFFDHEQSYPIITSVYSGPQTTRVNKAFLPSLFDRTGAAQALAELGFIVITLDTRGMPYRSKAFNTVNYGKRFGGPEQLEDQRAAIQQLAARYTFIDAERVGITGVSGGGYLSARALLLFPDFFKVAVSLAGNHDQRVYVPHWAHLYIGPDEDGHTYFDQSNLSLADKLQGKLLLIHGELDDNVQPVHTMQFAAALMQADKDFEVLIVPNANHAFECEYVGYANRKRADFFVRHLLNTESPKPSTIT
jgi:dipeptidyl-peptidase 4